MSTIWIFLKVGLYAELKMLVKMLNQVLSKRKPFTATGEIPYLKVYNIVNQNINFDYKPQFIPKTVHEKELKRCKCYPNDVLMNIVGPPLGKIALVTDQFPEWNINQALCCLSTS